MSVRICPICGGPVKRSAYTYCSLRCRDARHGTVEDRFWRKVDKRSPDECWPCIAATDEHGYGRFTGRPASQIAWEITHRRNFPEGMFACHSCDNPPCVNPAHIWPGTHQDNIRDAVAKGRMSAQRRTHCPNGHEYSPENTMQIGTHRHCRQCNRARNREYKQRARLALATIAIARKTA